MDQNQEKVMRDLLSNNFQSMIKYLEAMNVEVKKKLKEVQKEQRKKKISSVKVNGSAATTKEKVVHDGTPNEGSAN